MANDESTTTTRTAKKEFIHNYKEQDSSSISSNSITGRHIDMNECKQRQPTTVNVGTLQQQHSNQVRNKRPHSRAATGSSQLLTFVGDKARLSEIGQSQPEVDAEKIDQRQSANIHRSSAARLTKADQRKLSHQKQIDQKKNSLESLNSRLSISSANDESQSSSSNNPNKSTSFTTVAAGSPPLNNNDGYRCLPSDNDIRTGGHSSDQKHLGQDKTNDSMTRKQQQPGEQEDPSNEIHKSTKINHPLSLLAGNKTPTHHHHHHHHQDDDDTTKKTTTKQQQQQLTKPEPPFMFAGVLASVLGSVFFSFSILSIKLLPNNEGFSEKVKVLCFRGLFITILCSSSIIIQRGTIIVGRDELWVNFFRSVFGTLGILGVYSAINYISIGDATALIFSSPIWTSILGYFILNEPLQWLQLVALPATLFGIILIAHPALIVDIDSNGDPDACLPELSIVQPTHAHLTNQTLSIANGTLTILPLDLNATVASVITPSPVSAASASASASSAQLAHGADFDQRWPGIVIALGTSFIVSLIYIALKFRKSTPIQTTTFWFGACMLFTSMILQCFTGLIQIPDTIYEWSLLLSHGVTSWLGQSLLQWAFLYEEAGILSIVKTLDIAMTFILSAIFLEEEILWTSIVGATIISLVVVSIMLNEWLRKMTCSSNTEAKTQPMDDLAIGQLSILVGEKDLAPSVHQVSRASLDEDERKVIRARGKSSYVVGSKA